MASRVLLVVPAFNEASSIAGVLDSLSMLPYDVLIVDDGSLDDTVRLARDAGFRLVRHSLNMGYGAAVSTGFEVARREGYDVVVTFDADGQHNPGEVVKLVDALSDADVVIGVRKINLARMPLVKRVGNGLLNVLTFLLFGVWSSDSQSGLRAFNRRAVDSIRVKSNRYEVSSEILLEVRRKGLVMREVPVEVIYTSHSISKGTNVYDGFRILWRMLLHRPGGGR
ncbi:MAG: glycosyltransferase family 2 protein [Candidatus Altiarchaeota archaeon]